MRRTIMLTAALALLIAGSVVGPALAHHKQNPSAHHNAAAAVACGYTVEESPTAANPNPPDTHVTDFTSVQHSVERTDNNHILGAPLYNNDDGYFTLKEFSISTVRDDDGSTGYPTCPSLTYRLVLYDSRGGKEVGAWSKLGNRTTSLEFFPGDESFTFYDASSYQEACHYVEVFDSVPGIVYDRAPDEGCAALPKPDGLGATSYR